MLPTRLRSHVASIPLQQSSKQTGEVQDTEPKRPKFKKLRQGILSVANEIDGLDSDTLMQQECSGHSPDTKGTEDFRFVFSNYNGFPRSKIGLADFVQATKALQADCVGIAESHLDSSKNHVKATFQFATWNLATRATSTFSDPYGRIASQTFIGQNRKTVAVITALRVVDGTAGPFSAHAQQRAMLVTAGRPPKPQKIFFQDIHEHIQKLQSQGLSIILGIDANESIKKQNSGITNVHGTMFPNQQWASHRQGSVPIDFFFVSPDVLSCITRAGILPFDEVYDSDHRPLFFDLNALNFFQQHH